MGGTLESFHIALGSDDRCVIVSLLDHAAAAAVSLTGTGSGTLRSSALALVTPEENLDPRTTFLIR